MKARLSRLLDASFDWVGDSRLRNSLHCMAFMGFGITCAIFPFIIWTPLVGARWGDVETILLMALCGGFLFGLVGSFREPPAPRRPVPLTPLTCWRCGAVIHDCRHDR